MTVNSPFGDPALYVDFLFERRALLFDLGELGALPGRKLMRVSHAFVSHTHMDHFTGFDRLLRVLLGRDRVLHLFGPAGFIDQVEHKLLAYTWNLVHNYASDFTLHVTEVGESDRARTAEFHTGRGFRRDQEQEKLTTRRTLVEESNFRIRYTVLDHRIPSLAFALEEERHVNVWKNRLEAMGLATGPWLRRLKEAVLGGMGDEVVLTALNHEGKAVPMPLGLLRTLVEVGPGQKLVYVADNNGSPENVRRIVDLAQDAELLYIEAAFLDRDRDQAQEKSHMTARLAGEIARTAGVRQVRPFHFSPRYSDVPDAVEEEVRAAFRGEI